MSGSNLFSNCANTARAIFAIVIAAALAVPALAQLPPPAREIPLYSGVAPGSENWNYPERAAGPPDNPQAQNTFVRCSCITLPKSPKPSGPP